MKTNNLKSNRALSGLIVLSLIIILAGYWFFTKPALQSLSKTKKSEKAVTLNTTLAENKIEQVKRNPAAAQKNLQLALQKAKNSDKLIATKANDLAVTTNFTKSITSFQGKLSGNLGVGVVGTTALPTLTCSVYPVVITGKIQYLEEWATNFQNISPLITFTNVAVRSADSASTTNATGNSVLTLNLQIWKTTVPAITSAH